MIRLLDPKDPQDIRRLAAVFDEIAARPNTVYFEEGMRNGFSRYLNMFATEETDPAKQMYVSAEIVDDRIVRMAITASMNKLWTGPRQGMVHYFALLFWYTAPGYTKDNFLDNGAGKLAFDKFIDQGMYTYLAVIQGPKTLAGLPRYRKMFGKAQRINVFIDRYIDSQEKLDKTKEAHPGLKSLLPAYFKNPLIVYTGIIKEEFRNYDIV